MSSNSGHWVLARSYHLHHCHDPYDLPIFDSNARPSLRDSQPANVLRRCRWVFEIVFVLVIVTRSDSPVIYVMKDPHLVTSITLSNVISGACDHAHQLDKALSALETHINQCRLSLDAWNLTVVIEEIRLHQRMFPRLKVV